MTINRPYLKPADLPEIVPVFPLEGVLLLPRGDLPLNIFEPRYLQMIDDALAGSRLVVMVQPATGTEHTETERGPALAQIGCAGRITAFQETGDGRYAITLTGVARVRLLEEIDAATPYRQFRVSAAGYAFDFEPSHGEEDVDRQQLVETFRDFLEAHELDADWESVGRASNETLVNALSMMSPYGPREKQALLEAEDLKARSEMLIAVTEMALVRGDGEDSGPSLQ